MQMKILNTKKYLAHWEKNAKVINRQSKVELSISIYRSLEHLKWVLTGWSEQVVAGMNFDDMTGDWEFIWPKGVWP